MNAHLTIMDMYEHCEDLYSRVDAGTMKYVHISSQLRTFKVGFENYPLEKQVTFKASKQR